VSPEGTAPYGSWEEAIAALEFEALEALDPEPPAGSETPVVWAPPTHLGVLPLHLRERAEHVLAEQRQSVRNLEEMHRETGRHLSAIRAVPRRSTGQPVYLDTAG
jgi:hypothetical protein